MTRRYLTVGLLIAICFASCRKSTSNPWFHQARQLKVNSQLFWWYRAQNSDRWPQTMEDLRNVSANSKPFRQIMLFVDPDTGESGDWLVFDPQHGEKIAGHERIISAAPRPGGPYAQGRNQRMVMFETGEVTWITESDFLAATQRESGVRVQNTDKAQSPQPSAKP